MHRSSLLLLLITLIAALRHCRAQEVCTPVTIDGFSCVRCEESFTFSYDCLDYCGTGSRLYYQFNWDPNLTGLQRGFCVLTCPNGEMSTNVSECSQCQICEGEQLPLPATDPPATSPVDGPEVSDPPATAPVDGPEVSCPSACPSKGKGGKGKGMGMMGMTSGKGKRL